MEGVKYIQPAACRVSPLVRSWVTVSASFRTVFYSVKVPKTSPFFLFRVIYALKFHLFLARRPPGPFQAGEGGKEGGQRRNVSEGLSGPGPTFISFPVRFPRIYDLAKT